jgi:hypothetical protein
VAIGFISNKTGGAVLCPPYTHALDSEANGSGHSRPS